MHDNNGYELMVKLFIAFKDIILGGFGGIVAYMFDYSRQKKSIEVRWSNGAMFINLFIGAFVAYSFGTFIPVEIHGRDGIIGLIGVTSYAILGIVESRFARIIIDRLFGGNDGKL